MRIRLEHVALAVLLIGLFWLRIGLSTSVATLDYGAYQTVRQVEHIQATGQPLRVDPLSVTGNERLGSPVVQYLLAALTWATPLMYKILPNLFMVLLLIPVYFLARNLTKSVPASIASVVLAGSGPFVFAAYLNDPSPVPIAAFLLLAILATLHNPARHLYPIVGLTLLLTFVHPLVFILVLVLATIIALLRLEGFTVDRRIGELFLFTLFLATWFHVIVYKRALLAEGLRVVWKNLPASYASAAFGNPTFLTLLYGLGVVTFLFGVLGAYHALFERRERISLSVIGALLVTSIAVLLRIVEIRIGLMLLTILLSVMAAHGLHISAGYLARTKVSWSRYPLAALLIILFAITALLPALSNARTALANAPGPEELAAYEAARMALPDDAIVLTTLREASAFQYYTQRTTLTDDDFVLVHKGDEIVADITAVYTSRFVTALASKAEKLGITHIFFSPDAARTYGRDELTIDASGCIRAFRLTGVATLYETGCAEAR